MRDLTLDEVKEANRNAWCEVDRWYFKVAVWDGDIAMVVYRPLTADADRYPDGRDLPTHGWRHEDGCDCEFCRP